MFLFILCAFLLGAMALVMWLLVLTLRAQREIKRLLGAPEVARDGDGRPLRERL